MAHVGVGWGGSCRGGVGHAGVQWGMVMPGVGCGHACHAGVGWVM